MPAGKRNRIARKVPADIFIGKAFQIETAFLTWLPLTTLDPCSDL
jgi:hypothetical protein